jgi:hypothetical protein
MIFLKLLLAGYIILLSLALEIEIDNETLIDIFIMVVCLKFVRLFTQQNHFIEI